jgi:hypothetical protein
MKLMSVNMRGLGGRLDKLSLKHFVAVERPYII